MPWIHRTIIVPAALVAAARELGAALSPAGAGMYSTPLSPAGSEPATHWVSSGLIDESFAAVLSSPEALYDYARAGALEQGLTLTATLADAQALLAQGDVSDEPWDVVSARLGLVLCADPLM